MTNNETFFLLNFLHLCLFIPCMKNSIFAALNLPLGKRSVMHLVARENLPEPPSQGKLKLLNLQGLKS